jgi:hypothetical protein
MKALFDSSSDLVGWISDDYKHIFDTKMRWVGFIANNNVWNSRSGGWIGPFIGGNIHDRQGRPLAWSNRSITSKGVPMTPMTPMKPMTPMRPMTPMTPMRPMTLMTPMGGWSQNSFDEVFG